MGEKVGKKSKQKIGNEEKKKKESEKTKFTTKLNKKYYQWQN